MFWGYFGHFLCFGGVLVLLWVSVVFWTFFIFLGALWSFIRLIGVFWSYSNNRGYFGLSQAQGVLGSFLMFWGVFQSFIRFRGYIGLFLGIEGVLDLFFCVFTGHFGHFFNLWGILSYSSNQWYFALF